MGSQMPDAWVFLRGLAREARHWNGFVEQAQEYMGAPCLALDIPGVGEHYREASPSSIVKMRRALEQHRELQGCRRIGIVALSMGGMIALDWLQADPEKISHCVLINTSSRLSPFWQRLRPAGIWLLLKALLARSIERREQMVLNCVSNIKAADRELLAHWLVIQKQQPVSRLNIIKMLLAAARYKLAKAMGASRCRILFIASRKDGLVNSCCSERLAKYFKASLIMEEQGAGHDLPMDNPKWLHQQLRQFVASR